jgi:hypothetical protein
MKYIITFLFLTMTAQAGVISRFNHEAHEKGAFKNMQFSCSNCHNFSFDAKNINAKADANLENTTFKNDFKTTCHQCHNPVKADDPKYKEVPKTCVICHGTNDLSKVIKPLSHQNAAWKTTHSLNARTEGAICLNCHIQSDCLKCHLRRNDIEMQNHSRNFKFTHSIEARGQPHRCEACHTQNFCIKCHIGK